MNAKKERPEMETELPYVDTIYIYIANKSAMISIQWFSTQNWEEEEDRKKW